ncbi:MAG: winged helix-turn-helix transcriptional regulator [Solirubrobacterales bacterium]|nr:winged helix-turn-helix transcriptional regulator [Solirubrobacterales bacterium]
MIAAVAERLATLAVPNRVALLDALRAGEATVQELADLVGLTHQMASHHLAVLYRGGLLSRRREGAATVYAVDDWSSSWVIEQVAQSLSDDDA